MLTCPRCDGLTPRSHALSCLHCDAPLAPTLLARSGQLLRALVGATGAVLLAACYGPSGRYRNGPQYAGPGDHDGDGATTEIDCDDSDRSRYPGAADVFGDGFDQNCDGVDGWRDPSSKIAVPPADDKPDTIATPPSDTQAPQAP